MVWLFLGAVLGVIGTLAVFSAVGALQRSRERTRPSSLKSPQVPAIEDGRGIDASTQGESLKANSLPSGGDTGATSS
jgi:hypothetical protein